MPLWFCLMMLLPLGISAQQIRAIQAGTHSLHSNFSSLAREAYALMPYTQSAVKSSSYSFDGTDGRTGLSLKVLYRYKIGGAVFTNELAYSPDEASYYLAYLKGLQFFQGEITYKAVPIKGGPGAFLWHSGDKTATLIPEAGKDKNYGFFIKIYFPKDIVNEAIVVEDVVSKIKWSELQKLFAP